MNALPPGALARLDRAIAGYRTAVHDLVGNHRGPVAEVGREVATAQLAALLAFQDPKKVAGVAAMAVDILAQRPVPVDAVPATIRYDLVADAAWGPDGDD